MFSNQKAGIVSWGIGCGGVGTPAIYTHVAKASCWIDSQVSLLEKWVSAKIGLFLGSVFHGTAATRHKG